MKRILSIILIASIGFSDTLVVDPNVHCNPFFGCSGQCTDATNNNDYYNTISDALNNANKGDEIIICPSSYNESNLNVSQKNLNIHSYENNSSIKVYDNSGNPIFNVTKSGMTLQALSIEQNSNQMDINVTGNINGLTFKDLNITSEGKGIVLQENIDNVFDDVNITSKDRCFENDWSEFHGVSIKNSDFNQTSSGKWNFVIYATHFYDNNFTNVEINSSGYGVYFAYGLKDSNFTKFYSNDANDSFVVDSNNMDNIRFVDSNLSSATGRGISINDENLTNSYFDDFNISSHWESIYTKKDINNSTFTHFKIEGDSGFYAHGYIRNSDFENGEINASANAIYSSKELNQSIINELNITAKTYGLQFSKNSDSGAVNYKNSLTHLNITQTSDGSSTYSAIKFKKKANNSLFKDINISATERGIWFSTGGNNNKFDGLNIQSEQNSGFISSNNMKDSNFTTMTIHSNKYGFYFKKTSQNNNFKTIYIRVNNQKGFKFSQYSINDYFYDIDTNGTKGFDFNISEGDVVQKANIYTTKYEPIYFITIKNSPVKLYDLNLTSTKDNCIYVKNLDHNLSISTIDFNKNELNCSDYNGIQISNDSDKNLTVLDTNFSSNSSQNHTSRAFIKAKSLDTLYIKNNIFDSHNTKKGIYITGSLKNFDAYDNNFTDLNDTGIYIKEVNSSLDIEDNNITNASKHGIYIKSVADSFNKGEIKKNIIKNSSSYGVDIFYNSENDDAKLEVWNNCFYNNNNDSHQAYTYDKNNAKYDDGNRGNYWDDWSGSGSYKIEPSGADLYDNHPLSTCSPNSNNISYYFDAWDTFRDINDKNISTKIVSKDFNIVIASLDENRSEYQEFNGTVCSRVIIQNDTNVTDWVKNSFREENTSDQTSEGNPTFNVSQAIKQSKVEIIWLKNKDESCSDVESSPDHNETNSTDNFAIRPSKFTILNYPNPIYAGEDFNISFEAVNNDDKNATDYNESNGSSFDINVSEIKNGCVKGNYSGDVTFSDGGNTTVANYDEVGKIDINISDENISCKDRFAGVDCKDKNVTGHWNSDVNTSIGSAGVNISSNPYDINITNLDFTVSTQNSWLYMADDIHDMNITLNTTLKAFNKKGDTLQDFNATCYAKDINVTFYYDINNSNYDVNLTLDGNLTDTTDVNISDINKTLQISHKLFVSGEANSSYVFGIDRNYNNFKNPKNIRLKEANITTSKVAKNENNISKDANATFYYGRTYPQDLSTSKSSDTTQVSILVYADDSHKDFVSGYKEELLHWYLNKEHNNTFGEINATIPSTSITKSKTTEITSSINSLQNGVATVEVNTTSDTKGTYYIHLGEDKWLWYVPKNFGSDYNYSDGSDCSEHPCIKYNYEQNDHNESGVRSGAYSGVHFDINISKNSKGVRLLR